MALALCACPRPLPSPGPPSPQAEVPPPAPDPESLPCDRILRVVVRKQERTLRASCEGGGERSWTIALGREPLGPKRLAGDSRTPEGEYHLMQWRTSRFHRFLRIDYPSPADADAALTSALISYAEHAAILEAHRLGRLPRQDTRLGGELGLHGEGRRWRGDSQHLNWTFGCVAMSDEQIDFLIERAPPGTPISIEP